MTTIEPMIGDFILIDNTLGGQPACVVNVIRLDRGQLYAFELQLDPESDDTITTLYSYMDFEVEG